MVPGGWGSLFAMTFTTCHVTISLDGFLAGADQSLEEPLGVGGERLHQWMFPGDDGALLEGDAASREHLAKQRGAYVMGRNMFGPDRGEWAGSDWRGWWGDEPPYHAPVFVLTHHEREPLELSDTTFNFVTDGIESALDQAKEAAGDQNVKLSGGADVARQYLAAGLIDEMELHVVPVLLGSGERLLDDVGDLELEQVRAVEAPGVTHLKYRVVK
jgi:dihydrofolate reductase